MTRLTKADTFKCAVAVFSEEMRRHNMNPTNDMIVRLGIATDDLVQFSMDRSESVTFVFSDGSRAVVHAHIIH
jgi:hypothetical protein